MLGARAVGFLDDDPQCPDFPVPGLPLLGPLSKARELVDKKFFLAVGSPKSFLMRPKIVDRLGLGRESFETFISPSAFVSSSAKIGNGVVVFPYATVMSGAILEDQVWVMPHAVISHEVSVGAYTIISTGAIVSGRCRIGETCYLGCGSLIREELSVGNRSLIGMGSTVLSCVDEGHVCWGTPAKKQYPTRSTQKNTSTS
jgi:sugar O-acyltransferase (sialic acid O-acetyltransferase NeuD family)